MQPKGLLGAHLIHHSSPTWTASPYSLTLDLSAAPLVSLQCPKGQSFLRQVHLHVDGDLFKRVSYLLGRQLLVQPNGHSPNKLSPSHTLHHHRKSLKHFIMQTKIVEDRSWPIVPTGADYFTRPLFLLGLRCVYALITFFIYNLIHKLVSHLFHGRTRGSINPAQRRRPRMGQFRCSAIRARLPALPW